MRTLLLKKHVCWVWICLVRFAHVCWAKLIQIMLTSEHFLDMIPFGVNGSKRASHYLHPSAVAQTQPEDTTEIEEIPYRVPVSSHRVIYTHFCAKSRGTLFFFIDTTPVIESSQGTVVEAVAAFGLGGRASLQWTKFEGTRQHGVENKVAVLLGAMSLKQRAQLFLTENCCRKKEEKRGSVQPPRHLTRKQAKTTGEAQWMQNQKNQQLVIAQYCKVEMPASSLFKSVSGTTSM